jgi:tight adherence protein B
MLGPILYAMIFIGVLMIVEGFYLLVFGKTHAKDNKVNRRLNMLEQGGDREEVLQQLRKERERHQGARTLPFFSAVFAKAAQANIAASPAQLVMWMGVLAAGAFVIFTIGTASSIAVRAVVALVLGYAVVFIWVRNKPSVASRCLKNNYPTRLT